MKNDYLNDKSFEVDDDKELEKNIKLHELNKKYQPKLVLLLVQITVCLIILILATVLKSFGGSFFEYVKQWYNDKINDSLIVEKSIDEYKNVVNKKFSKDVKFLNQGTKDLQNVNLSVNLFEPLESGKITSKFGTRNDPITGKESTHNGLDIGAESGKPIYAVLSGTIKKAEKIGGYGNCVIIDHGNNIETLYAHCKSLEVLPGDSVKRGQEVALVGSTGRSTGSHLHFEILIDGKKINPEKFFNGTYV